MASFLLTSLVLSVLCLLNINCLPSDYSSEESSEEVSFLLSTSNWTDSFGNVSDGLELHFEEYKANSSGTESENVLILTPYVERGDINIARELAKVEGTPFPKDLLSYSGFFTVNKMYNSNMFFWFFPAEYNSENAPLILWLQGGPGQSAHIGIFMEIGPFYVNEDLKSLSSNPYSWCKNYSVLFVDNPIGTGFSFTDNDEGYSKNQSQISENLYSFLEQFFTMFPELRGRDFYIAGESYGAKHATSLAYTIHDRNMNANFGIHIKGIAIASGFVDPNIIGLSDFLYYVGLIDGQIRDKMKVNEINAKEAVDSANYLAAYENWDTFLLTYRRSSKFNQEYNFIQRDVPETEIDAKYFKFLQNAEVKNVLHVGSTKLQTVDHVFNILIPDHMISTRKWLEFLLQKGYKILLLNGQLDITCAYYLAENFYRTLEFRSIGEYKAAERKPWYVNGKLGGYTKSAGNFTEALVLNAGHMVSIDQPEIALSLLNKFIQNNI